MNSSEGVVVTQGDSTTAKREAEETVEMDAQTKKRQTAASPASQVQVGGSSSSGSAAVSPVQTE